MLPLGKTLDDLRKERRNNEDKDTAEKNGYRLLGASLPLLENDSPDIGESHIQGHQYAPAESKEDRRVLEEALSKAESEELAVPEKTCKSAENEVVGPEIAFLVVIPGLVLAVLIEAIDGIREETAESYHECGRKSLEYCRSGIPGEGFAHTETDVEACAHEAGQKGDKDTLAEVEILDGSFLGLFVGLIALHHAGKADDGNTKKGDHHSHDDRSGEITCFSSKQRSQYGTETGAGAKGN